MERRDRAAHWGLLVATGLAAILYWFIEPLTGRLIIPRFGGDAASWLVCLLYFQLTLLAGYGYAFIAVRRLEPKWQMRLHAALIALALVWLPLSADPAVWTPRDWGSPWRGMLGRLLFNTGPFLVVIAATPSLATGWARAQGVRRPYRVYAVSNAFSFLALFAYPLLAEPTLGLSSQAWLWSAAYVAFAAVVAALAFGAAAGLGPQVSPPEQTRHSYLTWALLAAAGSALLAVVTERITKELPVLPLLWLLPLGLYLATYVLAFTRPTIGRSQAVVHGVRMAMPLGIGVMAASAWVPWPAQIAILCGALFVCCLACHCELLADRQGPSDSAGLYLSIAAGGAAGTFAVAVAAPLLLDFPWESYIAFLACPAVVAFARYRSGFWRPVWEPSGWGRRPPPVLIVLLLAVIVMTANVEREATVASRRNFYGMVRVIEGRDSLGAYRLLKHGAIMHGLQYLDERQRGRPAGYYARLRPLFEQVREARAPEPIRVGVIGLGAGTLAAYGREGDLFRFYELNPAVLELAREQFRYLSDSPAKIEVVVGDGRVALERESVEPGQPLFDLFIVDAFSSEAIPTHLLTVEAARLYRSRLRQDGLMLLHISSRFLRLEPVIRGLAGELDLEMEVFEHGRDASSGQEPSTWIALSGDGRSAPPGARESVVWSDDFSSIWPLIDW